MRDTPLHLASKAYATFSIHYWKNSHGGNLSGKQIGRPGLVMSQFAIINERIEHDSQFLDQELVFTVLDYKSITFTRFTQTLITLLVRLSI